MFQEFKDILGYEGHYQVSNLGAVKSIKRAKERILTSVLDNTDYSVVCLSINGKSQNRKVHRLVAEAFISNPDNLPLVRHLDGNKGNNIVSNLAWGTNKDNYDDSKLHGTSVQGERVGTSFFTENQVIEIKEALKNWKHGDTTKLAKKYGVTFSAINHLRMGNSWNHIKI